MLARIFKTASELGIEPHEYDALCTVLYQMEDGEIPPHLVFMQSWSSPTPCGTAHCIAGWANEVCPAAFPEVQHKYQYSIAEMLSQRIPKGLANIFGIGNYVMMHLVAEKVPGALRAYLETGKCPY